MKTLVFILLSFTATAQLEIKQEPTVLHVDVQYFSLTKLDTIYKLYFKDKQYTQILVVDNITFNGSEELKQFFELCEDVIENKTTYTTEKYSINRGLKMAVVNKGSAVFFLTKKKIAKLKEKSLLY